MTTTNDVNYFDEETNAAAAGDFLAVSKCFFFFGGVSRNSPFTFEIIFLR